MDFLKMNTWYAYVYEKAVTDTKDVELIQELIGGETKRILEAACGGGRILSKLALAGHQVDGFDYDEAMLAWCQKKSQGFKNARCFQRDALRSEWGNDYDVVILAGNLLLNLVTNDEYIDSQQKMIRKASHALKAGGYLYLDFDCFDRSKMPYVANQERIVFEGEDDAGTKGKYISITGSYDPAKKTEVSSRRYEITGLNGHLQTHTVQVKKYFPSIEDVSKWLRSSGLDIVQIFGDFDKSPISSETYKAIIWAKKVGQ